MKRMRRRPMPTTDSSTMTVTRRGDREIVITRELDAPRELVFKTITDPKLISKWWGPRRYTTSVDKMDVRPGGEWRVVPRGPGGGPGVKGGGRGGVPPAKTVRASQWGGRRR